MKYEAPKAEVVRFDGNYFMTFSGNYTCPGYGTGDPGVCPSYTNNGLSCNTYRPGSSCENYSYNGMTCYGYNGTSGSVNGKWYDDNAPACGIF